MRLRVAIIAVLALCCGFEWEGRLARLRTEYESADAGRRREIVRMMSSFPRERVSDVLVEALRDDDPGVRAEAAAAAGRTRLESAVPLLLEWIGDPDADVRASAVRALGAIGDARATTPVVRALGDQNADVRRGAVEALAAIGTPEVVVPLLGRLDDGDASVRVQAARALARIGDRQSVMPLIGRARDEIPEVRATVSEALGDLRDPRALPVLVQALRDDSEDVQLAAIRATGRLGDDGATAALVSLLSEPNARRSRAIVAALGAIASRESVSAVVDALAREETRSIASEVLVELAATGGDERAELVESALVSTLEGGGPASQLTAIAHALARIGAERSIAHLAAPILRAFEAYEDRAPDIIVALGVTGAEEALVPILERLAIDDPARTAAALSALERFFEHHAPDGRAADPLLAALGRVRAVDRVRVIRLLGETRAARALPALRPLLAHDDQAIRRAAVAAIGTIGDPEGASLLFDLLDDRDARTRYEAARAIGKAASAEHVRRLLDRLEAPEPADRHAVLATLSAALRRLSAENALDAPARERIARALAAAIASPDDALSARAIDTARAYGSREMIPILTALLESGTARRKRAAIFALAGFDDAAAVEAIRRLAAPRAARATRATALAVLGEHGTGADADLLLASAETRPWPENAAAAFGLARLARRGVLRAEAVRDRLCAIAVRRDAYVRANATAAIAALGIAECNGGPSPHDWMSPRHAAAVRVAAARWLAVRAATEGPLGHEARAALDSCLEREHTRDVNEACAAREPPPLDAEADVYAYDASGRDVLVDRLVALRFADGSALVAHTDPNGHVALERAPKGRLVLDDPFATPLEP